VKSLAREPRFIEPDSGAVQASDAEPLIDAKDAVRYEDAPEAEEAPEESQGVIVVVVLKLLPIGGTIG
jgi:hypothetical protein